MSENMRVYEQVRNVPKEALKAIGGGRLKGMSDINPMWRIKMLTEMFGICGIGWKIEIVDKRLEQGSANEIVCFVDINLYIKSEGEWSAPIPGMGGSSFVTMEKSGAYTSDECYKMAYTDAISVACKSLGFAADVYYANDRTKYTNQEDKPYQGNTPTSPPPSTQAQQITPDTFPQESINEDLAAIERESQATYGEPKSQQTSTVTPIGNFVSEGQVKMLYAKWSNSEYKSLTKPDFLELLSAQLAKNVTDIKFVERSDINKAIKWLDEHKAA